MEKDVGLWPRPNLHCAFCPQLRPNFRGAFHLLAVKDTGETTISSTGNTVLTVSQKCMWLVLMCHVLWRMHAPDAGALRCASGMYSRNAMVTRLEYVLLREYVLLGGGSQGYSQGYGAPAAGGVSQTIVVEVPNDKVGLVIGKAGSTIKELEQRV